MIRHLVIVVLTASLFTGCASYSAAKREQETYQSAKVKAAADLRADQHGRARSSTEEQQAVDEFMSARSIDGMPAIGFDLSKWKAWWLYAKKNPAGATGRALVDIATAAGAVLAGDWAVKELNDLGADDAGRPETVIVNNSGPVSVPANASAEIQGNSGPVEVRP